MGEPRIELALDLLSGRSNWAGGATVLGCLRGVGAVEAAWRPAPDRKSLWELALHVAYWKYAVRRRLEGSPKGAFPRTPANFPVLPEPADEAAWKRDRDLLRDEHRALIAAVETFDPARLDDRVARSSKVRWVDLIFGVAMHDGYHVGQIQLMKRLYAASSSQGSPGPTRPPFATRAE